ncbi:MAG: amidohydrolase [Bacteroidetes bacterium]|nr:MAG: amidohydrolase [Bacteroidota bacterium]
MKPDGSDRKQITRESFRLLNNGVWMPDGQYVVARKHFTSTRSLGAGEMWMYHLAGGSGIQLTKRRNDQMDAGEPCVSPDGRYIYFSEDMSPGRVFEYNKDPNGQIYMIRRYDRQTGEVENITGGPGGAVRPQISPDGRLLAFVRRVRAKSVLFLHDLQTGEEWPLYDGLSKDQQETWAIFGVYPNFSWMPDGSEIVFYAKGKIWRIHIHSLQVREIPFEVEVKQRINEAVLFRQEVAPEEFEAKMIRHATTSPDGQWLAFNAAGHVYLKRLPDGRPVRATADENLEFWPAFSPDSRFLVFATWDDVALGALKRISLNNIGGSSYKLTHEKGYYLRPSYSPDGRQLVFQKGSGNSVLGVAYGKNPGIYLMPAQGGKMQRVHESGREPRFSRDGRSIYFLSGGGLNKSYQSLDLNTREVRTLFTAKYANQFVPSPDEQWLAFTELFQAYLIPFPHSGKPFSLSANTKAVPLKKLTRDAGTSLHWSGNSQQLHWVLGPEYFSKDIKEAFAFVPGAPDSLPPIDSTGQRIGLMLTTDVPQGEIAFTNARIISMRGDEVIEKGYVWVKGNKIERVGSGSRRFGPGVKVIDCSGKTIMPGLIDVHAHLGASFNGISPQQQWSYYANLAFGVTTTHDPSNNTEMVFSQHEMVEAGVMVGPRIFSTGTILYGAEGDFKAVINSLEDARSHLRRLKAVGAFSVKSYNQPRREQRQQVIQAARELRMMVYPEGGSTFPHNMSMILDGHTGIEHAIPVNPLYEDVIRLWAASGTAYTPTLIVGYGGVWGENYWYQKTQVWENQRQLNFMPRGFLDARARRRTMVPEEEFWHPTISAGCKALMDAGVKVQLGAHGQLQGLGAHWELWMLQQGGMSNMEALRAATQYGADYIGMGHALGSLEKGKLADLIVLNSNPLEDIRHSEDIWYVMKNGRLYDSMSMNEIGNQTRKRKPFYWETFKTSAHFDWHGAVQAEMVPGCGCMGAH